MPPRRSVSAARKAAKPILDVLIVECDSARLVSQGLSVADALGDFEQACHKALDTLRGHSDLTFPVNISVLRVADSDSLLQGMAALATQYRAVRAMLIVGHANEQGLQMAPGRFAPWSQVGEWFRPLQPRQVALLACKSGQPQAMQELSVALPTAKNILAAPGHAVKAHWPWMCVWLLMKSLNVRVSSGAQLWGQIAATFATGSPIYHWNQGKLRTWGGQPDLVKTVFERVPVLIEDALRQRR